ncbi:uncharacterized protein CTRU02_201719 [Colletotrichum truncatum]|uniref:Uncharacterized protein n=1 Tax=Colletotrichum truncatum TaxID=5467 RepID=A0ACC3ZI72_COLTU|nr:uncharacterized protein CTRU02_11605 [Colletotrichum truncatum]KAF6785620.1 hypothetical protein CTRU02_11605 [Colletotrichum truncatum]
MGATMSVIKTLIIPAVISLILFVASTYVILPLWRKWRSRYSQYLPVDTISASTVSLRHRIQNGIARMMVASTWRRNAHDRLVVATEPSDDGEDGEELGEVGEETRRAMSDDARRNRHDNTRRLSRDLEEGFRDDSDDSDDDNERNRPGLWR